MSNKELEKQHKEELQEQAFQMYVGGSTMQDIAETIGKHRNTVRTYIQDHADGLEPGDRMFRQRVSMARLDKVVKHATDLLENGDIKDSSLSRPQLLHQVIAAIKEQNKISGLHITLQHIQHSGSTVADLSRRLGEEAAAMGHNDFESYFNRQDYEQDEEDIEEAEVIEEDIPTGEQSP